MNFRILAASVWPRGRVFALLAAAALTVTLLAPQARAQQPTPGAPAASKAKVAPKAAPKAAPVAPAPTAQQAAPPAAGTPAAGGPAAPDQIQLIYAPWTKFCIKSQGPAPAPPGASAKQICFTGKDGRIESGQPVIAAVVIEVEGEAKKNLRVTLPLGMQLVHGTRIVVDNNPPAQSGFSFCYPNGCIADYELTPELLAILKKGQVLYVQAIPANNEAVTLPLPLQEGSNSFAKAYDGPPTDPKVFEENQKKLQEELQKRADEQRKKLEASPPAGGAGAANPAAK
jgi:invasion protein IalB